MSAPLFKTGQIFTTPAASELMASAGVLPHTLLARHTSGDFGDLSEDDVQANRDAITHGDRILSAYQLTALLTTGRVWIITEHDRSATTILLPSEY